MSASAVIEPAPDQAMVVGRRGPGLGPPARSRTARPGSAAAGEPRAPSFAGAAPSSERGRLDAVLAGGGAEPTGAVARGVQVDPVAARGSADTEALDVRVAQDDGEPGGHARHPALHLVGGGAVEVQVPRLPVVAGQ